MLKNCREKFNPYFHWMEEFYASETLCKVEIAMQLRQKPSVIKRLNNILFFSTAMERYEQACAVDVKTKTCSGPPKV